MLVLECYSTIRLLQNNYCYLHFWYYHRTSRSFLNTTQQANYHLEM